MTKNTIYIYIWQKGGKQEFNIHEFSPFSQLSTLIAKKYSLVFIEICIFTGDLVLNSFLMKKTKPQPATVRKTSTRKNRLNVMLNDDEMRAVNRYIEKYKVKNKSKFIREIIISTILKQFEEDHPTLF